MKISEIYPRKYINGEDLQGKPYTLTVRTVTMEEMHPQPGAPAERKPVLYFAGAQKGLILGPALARQLAQILGDDTDAWPGQRVTIYPQPMTVAGRQRIAIRARAATNGNSAPPETLQEEDSYEEEE